MPSIILAEAATPLGFTDFQPILTSLTSQFSVVTILSVIAGLLGVTVAFAFMWWGARKAISKIMTAVKSGKVSA